MSNKIGPADLATLRDLYLALEPGTAVDKAPPVSFSWMERAGWSDEKRAAVAALGARLICPRFAGNPRKWIYPTATRAMLAELFASPAFAPHAVDQAGRVQTYIRTDK